MHLTEEPHFALHPSSSPSTNTRSRHATPLRHSPPSPSPHTPTWLARHLVHVLAIAHKQAVAAQHALQRVAARAGGALAQRLLAALVAGLARYLVVHAVAGGVVAVLKQGPGGGWGGGGGGGGDERWVRRKVKAGGGKGRGWWGWAQGGWTQTCSPLGLVRAQRVQVLHTVHLLAHVLCRGGEMGGVGGVG